MEGAGCQPYRAGCLSLRGRVHFGETCNGGGRGSGKLGSVGACDCPAQFSYSVKVSNFESPTAEGYRGGGGLYYYGVSQGAPGAE